MKFLDTYKALIVTLLISGTLVLAMFSFHISKSSGFISESYYELEPHTAEELKAIEEELKASEALKSETNEAYNEDEEFKELMKNFKSMASNDFEKTTAKEDQTSEASSEPSDNLITATSRHNNSQNYALQEEERETFNKAKDILALHSNKKNEDKASNRNSSVSFSLSNRKKVKLPPPVYLCEVNGKIVVNITVDANGLVTDTYLNSTSSTDNQCLIDHALEYARNALFNKDASRKSQIGSITYYFKGKN